MTTPELAYAEIQKLVTSFKGMPASQRKGMNEMQTRLGYILPLFREPGQYRPCDCCGRAAR